MSTYRHTSPTIANDYQRPSAPTSAPPAARPHLGGGFIPRPGVRGYLSPDDGGTAAPPPANPTNPAAPANPEARAYTQDELNRMFGERAERERRALLSKLGVTDLEEATRKLEAARKLEADAEAARLKRLEEEGQYKSLLDETRAKKDAEITALKQDIEARDQRLRDAELGRQLERLASKAVRPDQVVALLRQEGAIRMDAEGKVYVSDTTGKPRLDERGNPLAVDAYVNDWFAKNPHHLPAQGLPGAGVGAGSTGSTTKIPGATAPLDPTKVRSTAYLRANIDAARAARAERVKTNQGKSGFF